MKTTFAREPTDNNTLHSDWRQVRLPAREGLGDDALEGQFLLAVSSGPLIDL
jgi:hypothetical protein